MKACGFVDVAIVCRTPLGYDVLAEYPVFKGGLLDRIVSLIGKERLSNLVWGATFRGVKEA
ncbi:MAG: hypothetical protein HYU64_21775 [Armatimonadetes bacterium]|nr:hypothetical protein [Armatimonadota bacterium]